MSQKHKITKISSIILGILFIFVVFIILILSPVAKQLIEKYDEQLTGRQITMDRVYANPFTGNVHISNLKIYELRSDSVFVSAKSVNVKIALFKLFSKTLEFSSIALNHPDIMIERSNNGINFIDIIRKFTPDKSKNRPSNFHVNFLRFKINDGIFHYREKSVPVNFMIRKVFLECPGKRWNSDSIDVKYSFFSGTRKGDMIGNFSMNVKNLNYRLDVIVHTFDLLVLVPYIINLKNFGSFSAFLDANLKVKGNFKEASDVTFTGMLAINKFHFGIRPGMDYGSIDKFQLAIFQLSPKENKYLFDSVSIIRPYFMYEKYDKSDNLQKMFGKKGSKLSGGTQNSSSFNLLTAIGIYIEKLSENFFKSDYKMNRLAIYNGNFIYNDYSLVNKFSLNLKPVNILSDSIDRNQNRIKITLQTGIKPSGALKVALSINPRDSSVFDMNYSLQRLPATLFNPYFISYTSYPLNRGIVELNGNWKVRNGYLKSNNHLKIIDLRLAKRIDNKDAKKLPMKLIMSVIRDKGNVIDYQIPVTGNLKRPKFNIKDVIRDALVNMIEKPFTTPYRINVKNTETDIEKALTFKWEIRQSSPDANQLKFINHMADFLSRNKTASIIVHPQLYVQKEKEDIALFRGKKMYFMTLNHKNQGVFSKNDSDYVEKMSVKDPKFNAYLNDHTKSRLIFTTQEKCALLIGSGKIKGQLHQLMINRENAFIQPFIKKGVMKQVKFTPSKSVIPFNGYSFYKIKYRGEIPEVLVNAYNKMNDLNNESPRKAYKKDRLKVR